ncbi:MAG: ribonuclease HI family protein [Candidatus Omnitrophica bacterium]|nr:ribonuclease HI family protein [Candidatus Omnitrophota bacterium]
MKKTKRDFLSLYVDGAARGNPGPAGVGIILEDEDRQVVGNIDKFIGNATNNVAEYTALITGMEEARRLGAKAISINTDSELLAKQLSGEYKVKNPVLKGLHEKARKALVHFDKVIVNNIPREQNKGADKLANKAIDAAMPPKSGRSFVLK